MGHCPIGLGRGAAPTDLRFSIGIVAGMPREKSEKERNENLQPQEGEDVALENPLHPTRRILEFHLTNWPWPVARFRSTRQGAILASENQVVCTQQGKVQQRKS